MARRLRSPRSVCDTLKALRHIRGLQHLSDVELAGLADQLELVRYPSGTVFFKDFEGNLAAPLRIIVQGHVFWSSIADPDSAGSPTLDAGAIFGLASINAWVRREARWQHFAVPDHPGFVAESHADLWVLELHPDNYHRAFDDDNVGRVVERLTGLYAARPYAAKFVHTLSQTPEFSRACPMHLSRVAEGGVLETWHPDDKPKYCDGSARYMALRFVVSGQVRSTDMVSGQSTIISAGEFIDPSRVFHESSPHQTFEAVGSQPAHVIRVRYETLHFTIRNTPGFARTLGPKTLDSWIGGPSESEASYPVIASGEMTLIVADPELDTLPLPALADVLGDTMCSHLGDRVTVVRLLPAGAGLSVTRTKHNVPKCVLVSLEPDPKTGASWGRRLREQLIDLAKSWGLLFDHILLEASGLGLEREQLSELMEAVVDLPCPTQISYLVASVDAWANLPERIGVVSGVNMLPTVLLGPKPPRLELGQRLQSLIARQSKGVDTRPPMRWTHKLPSVAKRTGHIVGQLFDLPSSYRRPWPLDAVRLRLRPELLRALETKSGDIELGQLELDSQVFTNAEISFQRWARAVSWRRVGMGIGGAGCQSYVAIPFIRKLRDAGVPLDVISGSSTGAFIGAFYSILGDRGLDELIAKRHHFGFAVAAAWYHNAPFELLLTYLTEGLDLDDLELPVIAVAARAADGETAYLTSSLAGRACMASGSLPPMVPTYIRNRRLLDGGLTLDVPTAVLSSAGAELIIGVQPIPRVNPRPLMDQRVFVPPSLRLISMLNPLQRGLDSYRSYLMLFRQAARGNEPNTDVVYEATTRSTHAALFAYGQRVAEEAVDSPALLQAVEEVVAEWERMKTRPPGRIIYNPKDGSFEIGTSRRLPLEGRDRDPNGDIQPHSRAIVHQIAVFLSRHTEFALHVELLAPEKSTDAEIDRWLGLVEEVLRCEELIERSKLTTTREAKLRRFHLEFGVLDYEGPVHVVSA